jgi:hypothetical protein
VDRRLGGHLQTSNRTQLCQTHVDEVQRKESHLPSRLRTDTTLYDQPLTIEIKLPMAWDAEQIAIQSETGTSAVTQSKPSQRRRSFAL